MNIPAVQRLSILASLSLAVGCVTPPAPMRELYTEAGGPLTPYPLDAESHEAYVAVQRLDGSAEGLEALFEAAGGQARLIFPSIGGALQQVSAVYVGHAAFAYDFEIWHHLRLFVVNREPHALWVELDDLVLESASEPEFVAATNRQRERIETTWAVEAGESRTLHLFYKADNVDPELAFAFALRAPRQRGEQAGVAAGREVGPWLFSALLRRHFVLRGIELTELERMVALGETLPVAKPPPEPWAAPHLTPVPGPAAEASGGEGAGG